MRILYIEDEPADVQLVARYATMTHHDLTVAANMREADDALTDEPDLILVDILIDQQRAGYNFIRKLRADGKKQPVIAVTGLALQQEIEQCFAVGCTDVLPKPYAIRQLADLIKRYKIETPDSPQIG